MYYLTFFVFGPLFIPLLERRLDLCLKFSAILTTIGTWVIWSAGTNYTVCLIGYFFVGVSEAFYLAVPVCIIT
jgi:FLVCR family feline leukemia virus subgroup C receptor-related protein